MVAQTQTTVLSLNSLLEIIPFEFRFFYSCCDALDKIEYV